MNNGAGSFFRTLIRTRITVLLIAAELNACASKASIRNRESRLHVQNAGRILDELTLVDIIAHAIT